MSRKSDSRDNQCLSRRKAMLRIAANVSKAAAVTVAGAAMFAPAQAYTSNGYSSWNSYTSGGNVYASGTGVYASTVWGYSAYSDSAPYVNSYVSEASEAK